MTTLLAGKLVRALATILFALSLLLAPAGTSAEAAGHRPDPIHPLLARMADENPSGTVRVIVQGHNPKDELGRLIEHHGGKSVQPLSLLRGYAAEMPAGRVRTLAKHPSVKWISVDAPMVLTAAGPDGSNLRTLYPKVVRAPALWNAATPVTGAVTVAVIDSGVSSATTELGRSDFVGADGQSKIVARAKVNGNTRSGNDGYGHGTHVAGIIASNGSGWGYRYIGIAPDASLVSVKVTDDQGMAYVSDVIAGLQWVLANRATHNIRVVNLSLVSSVAESHLTSPLDAAVEKLWLAGIVVVVSAGNLGPNTVLYPPANDPLVVTVGAADTNGTVEVSDDVVPEWSSYGVTQDDYGKPDVVAPGRQMVSNLASRACVLAKRFPDRIEETYYIGVSGTSTAAPVVAGIAALALQAHPDWTPDQVKSALKATARPLASAGAGAGEVDALGAVSLTTAAYANGGVALNQDVTTLVGATTYDSATWNSATWNSAMWNSATWNSATWNNVTGD